MTYEDSIRVLLDGITGANAALVIRETGLSKNAVYEFLAREHRTTTDKVLTSLAWFVWRRLNAHVLLCDDDRVPVIDVAVIRPQQEEAV